MKFLLRSQTLTLDGACPIAPNSTDEAWECLTLEEFVYYLTDMKIKISIPMSAKNYDAMLELIDDNS